MQIILEKGTEEARMFYLRLLWEVLFLLIAVADLLDGYVVWVYESYLKKFIWSPHSVYLYANVVKAAARLFCDKT